MSVTVTGIEETLARLRALRDRAVNLEAFLDGEAALLEGIVENAWQGERSPSGERWEPSEGDGGSLRRAHRVSAGGRSLRIEVPHRAASFRFFGTSHQPARNPLPLDRSGRGLVLSMRGAAGDFWRGHAERLRAYLTGAE